MALAFKDELDALIESHLRQTNITFEEIASILLKTASRLPVEDDFEPPPPSSAQRH